MGVNAAESIVELSRINGGSRAFRGQRVNRRSGDGSIPG